MNCCQTKFCEGRGRKVGESSSSSAPQHRAALIEMLILVKREPSQKTLAELRKYMIKVHTIGSNFIKLLAVKNTPGIRESW